MFQWHWSHTPIDVKNTLIRFCDVPFYQFDLDEGILGTTTFPWYRNKSIWTIYLGFKFHVRSMWQIIHYYKLMKHDVTTCSFVWMSFSACWCGLYLFNNSHSVRYGTKGATKKHHFDNNTKPINRVCKHIDFDSQWLSSTFYSFNAPKT